jgi:hypothetical protein
MTAATFSRRSTALRPISENTLNMALRPIGYGKDEMTSHGFRSTAGTLLSEQGWHPDLNSHNERGRLNVLTFNVIRYTIPQ